MDPNEHHTESTSKVIAFDTLFCTNHIQMLKVMLPYMDNQTQKSMAVYIKFLELNYTMEYFRRHPNRAKKNRHSFLYGCLCPDRGYATASGTFIWTRRSFHGSQAQ